MTKELLSIPQLYAKGKENLIVKGFKLRRIPPPDSAANLSRELFPPEAAISPSTLANRKYLDSLFFRTRFLNPIVVDNVDTRIELFGVTLKTPIFCSALSLYNEVLRPGIADIANGLKKAGALMMLGMGGTSDLQRAVDTGVPVVKIVKPYRKTELIYEKIKDAERRGCVAVGMDIDHSCGRFGDVLISTDKYGLQNLDTLRQIVSSTKLPFIVKGVLSVNDADAAVRMGARAIIVSNHGFSAIDSSVPSMVALPDIVGAVGDKLPVLIDSGFKNGNDVLKALAFGAKAVGFASSIVLAWAADESGGVENLINQITAELSRTMAATGYPRLSTIDRSAVIELPSMT